jgi:hypothetical protein
MTAQRGNSPWRRSRPKTAWRFIKGLRSADRVSHGWSLSADDWDTQMMFFLNHGYRVIAHDRRGAAILLTM